jgi:hypothetical protein
MLAVAAMACGAAGVSGSDAGGALNFSDSPPPVDIQRVVRDIDWAAVDASTLPAGVTVVTAGHGDGPAVLRIDGAATATQPAGSTSGAEKRIVVTTVDAPGVASNDYAIVGQVAYRGVDRGGYLEMLSTFADGQTFFSRTMNDSGPMARLAGSSDWRWFVLPFHSNTEQYPQRLTLSVVLEGDGMVELGPVQLVELTGPFAVRPAWQGRMGGILGAVLGTVLGLLGATIGTLNSMGKARRLTLSLLVAMGAGGVMLLVAAGVLAALRQPFAIVYPLGLSGLISAVLGWSLLPQVRRRYEQLELRRMSALDAGR